jgi:hypothetical protein
MGRGLRVPRGQRIAYRGGSSFNSLEAIKGAWVKTKAICYYKRQC